MSGWILTVFLSGHRCGQQQIDCAQIVQTIFGCRFQSRPARAAYLSRTLSGHGFLPSVRDGTTQSLISVCTPRGSHDVHLTAEHYILNINSTPSLILPTTPSTADIRFILHDNLICNTLVRPIRRVHPFLPPTFSVNPQPCHETPCSKSSRPPHPLK